MLSGSSLMFCTGQALDQPGQVRRDTHLSPRRNGGAGSGMQVEDERTRRAFLWCERDQVKSVVKHMEDAHPDFPELRAARRTPAE